MKKNLFLMMGAIVALSLVGCNNEKGGGNEPEPEKTVTFNMTATNATATTIDITITPSDTTVFYFANILDANVFDVYSEDSIAIILLAQMEADYEQYADAYKEQGYGDNFAEVELFRGALDGQTVSGLDPETNYILFAFVVDTATIAKKGDFAKKSFTTLAVQKSNNQISFAQDANEKNIIHVTATTEDPYLWIYGPAEEVTAETALATLEGNIDYYKQMGDAYGIDFLSMLLSVGNEDIDTKENFEMGDEGDYIFFACGVEGGIANTDAFLSDIINVTTDMCADTTQTTEPEAIAPRRAVKATVAPKMKKF